MQRRRSGSRFGFFDLLSTGGSTSSATRSGAAPVGAEPIGAEPIGAAPDKTWIPGYDCEFVGTPPDESVCPICLHILREPCILLSCKCGIKLCLSCAERDKRENKRCPVCKHPEFIYAQDYGLERSLRTHKVACANKIKGCKWQGILGDYENHLNENPSSPRERLRGCDFVKLKCAHGCLESFLRRYIDNHQKTQCLKRPFTCEYCKKKSTYDVVTESHYAECKKYPVDCPNKCREEPFERQELDDHTKNTCPLTQIKCPLECAGCKEQISRQDVPEHIKDTAKHLPLLATAFVHIETENVVLRFDVQDLKKVNEELKKENQDLKSKVQGLTKDVQYLKKETGRLATNVRDFSSAAEKKFFSTLDLLSEETRELKQVMQGFPIDFRVDYPAYKIAVDLPSFYALKRGYRFRITVFPKGDTGMNKHVAIYVYQMEGAHDEHLNWPCQGIIELQIVDQGGEKHLTKKFRFKFAKKPASIPTPDRVGTPNFISHSELAKSEPKYIKDGFFTVRVISVKLPRYFFDLY